MNNLILRLVKEGRREATMSSEAMKSLLESTFWAHNLLKDAQVGKGKVEVEEDEEEK